MPWAQSVEAFQEHLETGNRLSDLSDRLPNPLAGTWAFPSGADPGRFKSPESVPLPTFFNFQRAVCRFYKILRSSPTGS
jgi:hypothetical protein